MSAIEIFGFIAVLAMVTSYSLEGRSPGFVLLFAAACLAAAVYAALIRSWPFACVESVWSVIAFRRWLHRRRSPSRAAPSEGRAEDQTRFEAAVGALQRGDFSLLEPAFTRSASEAPAVLRWHGQGRFESHPKELAEALTCACFLGAVDVAEHLLARGVAPVGGDGTGLNALHWASNRGQLAAVRLLLRNGAPLEVRNAYGGTVLGGAVWAAVHESKPAHLEIIEELLRAHANVAEAAYPTGLPELDELLRRYGARGG